MGRHGCRDLAERTEDGHRQAIGRPAREINGLAAQPQGQEQRQVAQRGGLAKPWFAEQHQARIRMDSLKRQLRANKFEAYHRGVG
jgi:hypothetical protein